MTGPAENLFVKVDNESDTLTGQLPSGGYVSEQLVGGNAIDVANGKTIWVPGNRVVRRANRGDFLEAYHRYHLRELRERAPISA